MDEDSLKTIELQIAIVARRITSINSNNKFGNLDRSAYLLLHQIASHGSAGVKALACESHLDISTVSRQVAALEKKGYVYRIPDPSDGRAYSLQITDFGKKEFQECKEARLEKMKGIFRNWTEEECTAFGILLKKYNQSVLEI
ncbi:MAG TPA: MarR family transcriptional regulator [Paenibacillaceae bacterium]|nr:MarR family transcriptional regulator [Paenibacillaceae bacterium]